MIGQVGGRYNMQKIYIDKNTNEVAQIITEDYSNFENYSETTFGNGTYLIEVDSVNSLDSHNYKYNKAKKEFIKIDKTEVLESEVIYSTEDEIKRLKEEQNKLNEKLDKILKAI